MTEKLPLVIGVDPGETTGLVVLGFENGAYVLHLATEIGWRQGPVGLVRQAIDNAWMADRDHLILSVERFIVRGRAARSAHAAAGEHAREIIGGLTALAGSEGYELVTRTASAAKGWATDHRLKAASLYVPTRSTGGHRRDACRHALMTGVMRQRWTDPLSTAFTPK